MADLSKPPVTVTPELASSQRRASHRLACWREVNALAKEIVVLSTTAGRAAGALASAGDLDDTTSEAVTERSAAYDVDDLAERLRSYIAAARITQR